MTRKPIIAGNWKMHNAPVASEKLIEELKAFVKPMDKDTMPTVVVAPVFISLPTVLDKFAECACGKIKVAAQNCYYEAKGAFTGEVSAEMLKEIGVEYVIIGHSERRQYFGETDEMINKKAKAILANNMIPIICCGETLEQREAGVTDAHLEMQIRLALAGISNEEIAKSVIAYEPIWAIGTGKTCDAKEADRTIAAIRNVVKAIAGADVADAIRILYGGSVKPETIKEQMAMENIDGALVGGASLKAESFAEIIKGAM